MMGAGPGRGATVAHVLWEHEDVGSNPTAPTIIKDCSPGLIGTLPPGDRRDDSGSGCKDRQFDAARTNGLGRYASGPGKDRRHRLMGTALPSPGRRGPARQATVATAQARGMYP